MGAGGAGLTQEQNGVVLVCGQFDPGAVATLLAREPQDVRPGPSNPLDQRVVDKDGLVGFDGLAVGGLYFVTCYSGGHYEVVRATAQDPSEIITLLQPPVGPIPTTIGTQSSSAAPAPPAPPEAELETGLPEGVTSPLGVAAPADPLPPAEQEAVAVSTPPASGTGVVDAGAVGADSVPVEAEVEPAAPTVVEPAPAPTPEADPAPVEPDPVPAASSETPAEPAPDPAPAVEPGTPPAPEAAPEPEASPPATPEAPPGPETAGW